MSGFIARRLAAFGIAAVLAVSVLPARAQDVLGETGVKGAGSSFFYPILSRWSREYRTWLSRGGDFPTANGGLEDPPASSALQYEPVGSLAGALRLNAGAVDFGASDMPLRSEELAALGLGQFPVVIGGGGRGRERRRCPRGRDQAHRARARRDLSREGIPLVGSSHQGAQPGADAA